MAFAIDSWEVEVARSNTHLWEAFSERLLQAQMQMHSCTLASHVITLKLPCRICCTASPGGGGSAVAQAVSQAVAKNGANSTAVASALAKAVAAPAAVS